MSVIDDPDTPLLDLDKDFIGQELTVVKIRVLVDSALERGDQCGHVLLTGPGGTGKTTLAAMLAARIGSNFHDKDSTALGELGDMIETLTALRAGDVLGIDEVHGLSRKVFLLLYRVLLTGQFSVAGRPEPVKLPPFTLVAATTDPQKLTASFRERFDLTARTTYYAPSELAVIITRYAESLLYALDPDGADYIAVRSRGVPRIAKRLLRRGRDAAQAEHSPEVIRLGHVVKAMAREGIDALGLTELDRDVLNAIAIKWVGRAIGLAPILAFIGDADARTSIKFLERIGLIESTKSGRIATLDAYKHLGIDPPAYRGRGRH